MDLVFPMLVQSIAVYVCSQPRDIEDATMLGNESIEQVPNILIKPYTSTNKYPPTRRLLLV